MLIEILTPFLEQYGFLITLLIGILGGEIAVITLSFLAANGILPLWWIIVFVTIGQIISDIIVYGIGRSGNLFKLNKKGFYSKAYKKIDVMASKITNNFFSTFLYAKFIYGLSIPTLIYYGAKKYDFRKFLLFDIIIVLFWMAVIVSIGWFAGSGFSFAVRIMKNPPVALFIIALFMVFLVLVKKWIDKKY